MSLITGISTFEQTVLPKDKTCSACGKTYKAGETVLAKTYQHKKYRNQTCWVVLCNRECWEVWDDNFYQSRIATKRARGAYAK